jgi:CheY-like chemotaxis protein
MPQELVPVPLPTAPAAAPSSPPPVPRKGESVLIAMPDSDLAKRTAAFLSERGCEVLRTADGVETMLEIQRKLPRAVVLAADLPKMFGFQICEIVKRNPSLRGTWVVLVGAIHHQGRYRREAADLYGADVYLEGLDLPEGLLPLLEQGGLEIAAARRAPVLPPPPAAPPRQEPTRLAPPRPAPPPPRQQPAPSAPLRQAPQAPVREAPKPPPPMPPAAAALPRPRRDDGLEQERAKAERLARIVVSDIVLYNEERFTAAARAGNVFTAMAGDLAEGRALFEERIDARVRAERDHLKEELLRSAKLRGMR